MEWYNILIIIAIVLVAYKIFTGMTHFLFKLAVIIAFIIFLLSGVVDIKKALDFSEEVKPLQQLEFADEPAAPIVSNNGTIVKLNNTNVTS